MKYLMLIYANEAAAAASGDSVSPAYAAYTEAMKKAGVLRRRRTGCGRPPTATTVRVADGKTQGARRPLCRDQGAARRLLPDRRARPRRGARLGGALPGRRARHDRGAADLADVVGDARRAEQRARAAPKPVARQSYGKLVAFLAARTRDVAAAEDALADAFAAALADWPQSGVPRHPEAWLLTVARRKPDRCGAGAARRARRRAPRI